MKVVFIFAEGPTEETFIKRVLSSHLAAQGLHLKPFNTGGTIKYQSLLRKLILRQVNDSGITLVTTIFDLYGLPKDFPGRSSQPSGSCYDRVAYLEQALGDDIAHRKFLPYLSLHEFEALLFAGPEEIDKTFPASNKVHELLKIKTAHSNNPEEINDGQMTSPSKRIQKLYQKYEKPLHGFEISQRIGLETIRSECLHFNEWLTKLEHLGHTSS
jgi:Domain of unknown function (DUF4276)